jgi:aminoglycoside phosphotransferase (APT) family kinase protein
MLTQVQDWLTRLGFPGDIAVTPMTPGLGHTMLWRVSSAGPGDDLVLRMFPAGDTVHAEREALAMRTAAAHGVPVPAVVTTGAIEDRPALLMTLAPGETVATVLERRPEDTFAIGEQLGRLLGKVNGIPAPAGLAPEGAWLERAGPALVAVRHRLEALPNPDRLLHLDYHPENVLMDGDEVTAIIDWTNTLPGPPHLDLGRSRAILRMVRRLPDVTPEVVAGIERFEAGLIAGHESVHGPDPEPDLTLAWGVGMLCVDFAPQAGRPESWVTADLVASLERWRDGIIAGVLES